MYAAFYYILKLSVCVRFPCFMTRWNWREAASFDFFCLLALLFCVWMSEWVDCLCKFRWRCEARELLSFLSISHDFFRGLRKWEKFKVMRETIICLSGLERSISYECMCECARNGKQQNVTVIVWAFVLRYRKQWKRIKTTCFTFGTGERMVINKLHLT